MPRFGLVGFADESVKVAKSLTKIGTRNARDEFFIKRDCLGILLLSGTQFGDVFNGAPIIGECLKRRLILFVCIIPIAAAEGELTHLHKAPGQQFGRWRSQSRDRLECVFEMNANLIKPSADESQSRQAYFAVDATWLSLRQFIKSR